MNEAQCRRIVHERRADRCERCGRYSHVEMHHRQNRSAGGKWCPANIVGLCPACHRWVTEHPKLAGGEGLHLSAWQDPSACPVTQYGGRVVTIMKADGSTERLS